MAEIRIQEKRKPVWPWILIILLLVAAALLLYYFLNRDDNNNTGYESVPADTTVYYDQDGGDTVTPADDVDQFVAFTAADTSGVFNKEYVSNGLNLLTGAVYNVLGQGDTAAGRFNVKMDSLMSYTQNLTDTASGNFSREVNKSMTTTYDILSSLQEENFPDLDNQVNDLRTAVRSYKPNTSIEAQEETIRNFFNKSGSILSNMKNTVRTN